MLSESLVRGEHAAEAPELSLLPEPRAEAFDVLSSLSRDIAQFEASVDNYTRGNDGPCRRFLVTVVQKALRRAVQKNAYLRRELPSPVLMAYGSVKTRLALPCSDIDLVLTGSQQESGNESFKNYDNRQEILLNIAEYIGAEIDVEATKKKKNKGSIGNWVDEVFVIPSETMPLLMLQSSKILKNSTLQIDLTVENKSHTGLPTVALVEHYLDALPPLRSILLVLKQLMRNAGLNKPFSGGLASYSLFLMAAAFISQEDVSQPIGALTLKLLAFYSGVAIRGHSTVIAVEDMSEAVPFFDPATMYVCLPPTHKRGTLAIRRGIPPLFQTSPQSLVIQDPCNPLNNVGRPSYNFSTIQSFVRHLFMEFSVQVCCCCHTPRTELPVAGTTTCRSILKRVLYLSTLWPRERSP